MGSHLTLSTGSGSEDTDLNLLFQKPQVEDRVRSSDGRSSCLTEIVGIVVPAKEPSSLSVKETLFQNQNQEEDPDGETAQRLHRTTRRQARKNQLRRLHRAQVRAGESR